MIRDISLIEWLFLAVSSISILIFVLYEKIPIIEKLPVIVSHLIRKMRIKSDTLLLVKVLIIIFPPLLCIIVNIDIPFIIFMVWFILLYIFVFLTGMGDKRLGWVYEAEDLFLILTGNSNHYSNPFLIPDIDSIRLTISKLSESKRIKFWEIICTQKNKKIITGDPEGKSLIASLVANYEEQQGKKVFFMDGIKISSIQESNKISARFELNLSKTLMFSDFIIIDNVDRIEFTKSQYLVNLLGKIFASKSKSILLTTQDFNNLGKLPEKMKAQLERYEHVDL